MFVIGVNMKSAANNVRCTLYNKGSKSFQIYHSEISQLDLGFHFVTFLFTCFSMLKMHP
jgi:hypothetical protein